jgi:hypothetical protein
VAQAAERLGVARSTAHRLLTMLVYRDFAVQDDSRVYHAGPVLELAAHSQSATARLRAAALPHLQQLVNVLDETAGRIGQGEGGLPTDHPLAGSGVLLIVHALEVLPLLDAFADLVRQLLQGSGEFLGT